MEQNAKAHKEEECTSNSRNPEKIQRESEDELHTVGYCKLERCGGLLFSDLPKSGGS
jgi:hypothetical protein